MDKKKPVSLSVVFLNWFCALIWNLNLAADLIFGYTNRTSFPLRAFCAVIWTVCAIIWIFRYRNSKKENNR